jgi:hypothetical protein
LWKKLEQQFPLTEQKDFFTTDFKNNQANGSQDFMNWISEQVSHSLLEIMIFSGYAKKTTTYPGARNSALMWFYNNSLFLYGGNFPPQVDRFPSRPVLE